MVNYKPNNNIAKFNEKRKNSRDVKALKEKLKNVGQHPPTPKKDPELSAKYLEGVIIKNLDTMKDDPNSDPKEIREWLKLGHKNIEVKSKVKIKPKTIFDEEEY